MKENKGNDLCSFVRLDMELFTFLIVYFAFLLIEHYGRNAVFQVMENISVQVKIKLCNQLKGFEQQRQKCIFMP